MPLPLREHIYYRWLVTTLVQERFYTAIAIAGFLCLTAVAALAVDWLGHDRIAARTGPFLAVAGAAAWIAGSLIQLGGHRAVGLMATHLNSIQATNSISFTVDMTSQAFTLAAFTLLGAGMLAFARAGAQTRPEHHAWAAYTALLAALLLLTAWSYAAGNGNLTDLLLLAGGVARLPAWLIWTAASQWAASGPRRRRTDAMTEVYGSVTRTASTPFDMLTDALGGLMLGHCLVSVARFGVADALDDMPRTAAELAAS